MSKNVSGASGKNLQEGSPLPNNFSGALSSAAKTTAPKVEGNPYTPSTSQSNIRGKQGQ